MKITIQLRGVYGTIKVYPVCNRAKAFASIAGASTHTRNVLQHIDALGYGFENQAISTVETVSLEQLERIVT